MALLEIENLKVSFRTPLGDFQAVRGLSLSVEPNETLAIVGESGCGKSVTALSILGLVKSPPAVTEGAIRMNGRDIVSMSKRQLRQLRGKEIGMIFQEPMTSLNPVMTVGRQIGEIVRLHEGVSRSESLRRAEELLTMVGISDAKQRLKEFPHRLSGGMRQRVVIAMALACNPKLLIADEPTTALDVTIQAQVLDLIRDLKDRYSAAIVLITHDLGVVAEMAERVVIMYAGQKVEEASVEGIFTNARHPYTRALLAAVPVLGSSLHGGARSRLAEIPGTVPRSVPAVGCAFAERCSMAIDVCRTRTPQLEDYQPKHVVACHRSHEEMVP